MTFSYMLRRLRVAGMAALVLAALLACNGSPGSSVPRYSTQLARTTNGIAHIRSDNFAGLGYGLGYAYAQDNICMLADSMLTVRGERSRFFGAEAAATAPSKGEYGAALDFLSLKNEDSDFFFKAYLDLETLRAGYMAGKPEIRDLLDGYAAGYNRYLRDNAGQLPAACNGAAWVRSISTDDLYLLIAEKALHGSGEVFAAEVVAAARSPASDVIASLRSAVSTANDRRTDEPFGSNALAVGRDLSANGRGLLLGNPHYPWTSTDRFYQVHLTVPGRYDAMGVILGGLPIVVIGFNKDVAWTHTVTKALHFTTFKLTLDQGDPTGTTYLYDGLPEKMTAKVVEIAIRQPDGTLKSRSKTFYFARQGALMLKPEAGLLWTSSTAYVLGDPNRNNTRLLEQWLEVGQATGVQSMRDAMGAVAGLPWINTVAADRAGNAMYVDASVVPHVTAEQFSSSCMLLPALLTLDGSRSSCGWGRDAGAPNGIFSPLNAPIQIRTDYVGNSNDSYWLSNPRALLTGPAPSGYSPLYGQVAVEQSLRTRIGFLQMDEAIKQKAQLQADDLRELLFANRIYAAELVLPDLLPACGSADDALVRRACDALSRWDRRADLDSRGAVLFREFWNLAAGISDKWRVPLNVADPVTTPFGVNPAAIGQMLAALKTAASRLQSLGIPFDGRLGDFQDETRNGVSVPIHGGIGDIDGAYNSIHMSSGLDATGYHDIAWGTSYIQIVGFDEAGPVAQGLLVYGQSTDPRSPYYADQLPLYSEKSLRPLPFSMQQIVTDPSYQLIHLQE